MDVMALTSPAEYLSSLQARLAQDGCQPRWESWNGTSVLIGRRKAVPPPWMGRLHVFTVAAAFTEVTVPTVTAFARTAQLYAGNQKGGLLPPGLGYVLITFPCLVSERVAPDALAMAESWRSVELGTETRPVVVDVTRGVAATFRRKAFVGRAFASFLVGKVEQYFDGALTGSLPA
jgi:hypothetical protein